MSAGWDVSRTQAACGALWREANKSVIEIAAPHPIELKWCITRQQDMDTPLYAYWIRQLNQYPSYHRKGWEYLQILQTLWQFGMLKPGMRGIGFGVGTECLPSYFASKGVAVLATDSSLTNETMHWFKSNQHSAGDVGRFNSTNICSLSTLRELVTYREVDMNNIQLDPGGFDFTWSAGSLDHLGTLGNGLEFVVNSMRTLKPGGVAVHTTEYNLGSNDWTIERGGTVFYRKKDVEAFYASVSKSFIVPLLDLTPGDRKYDLIDARNPPHSEPHLRVNQGKLTATSIVFILRKPE